jgi:hypothetical protein
MGLSFVDLLIKSLNPRRPTAKTGLSMVMILFLYTFGENLEILVYLYWQGMVMMGIAFHERPLPAHSLAMPPLSG